MVNKPRLIYVSHFLSAWGDRMWSFAVALFLMDLESETLILPAAFGLTLAASVLMFGPLVGNWIDRSPRLYAARLALVVQNSTVALCAIILLVQKLWEGVSEEYILFVEIFAIILGAIARLASTASLIVIQRDWIVVIAGGNSDTLSQLNSVMRRIDLSTKLLAPFVCGQIMTLASLTVGCGFVAGWNVVSMFVEYILLQVVYNQTPALAQKSDIGKHKEEPLLPDAQSPSESLEMEEHRLKETEQGNAGIGDVVEEADTKVEVKGVPEVEKNISKKEVDNTSFLRSVFSFVLVIPNGWKLYMSQKVTKVGIGMACLYMTVLGFDAITVSYAYNQCFSELLVGMLFAACATTGILSTFVFTPLCSKLGLVRTGLLASYAQIVTLIPCVASVFVAGSPFFLLQHGNAAPPSSFTAPNYTATVYSNYTSTQLPYLATPQTPNGTTWVFLKCLDGISPPSSYLSLSLLMGGSIAARIGLWGFDLAVTQLFQEHVAESERGVVGGVQSSLNCMMDLLHFILVLALPSPEHFGILVLLSALFVCLGHFLYALFSVQHTGKFFACQ